MAIQDKRNRSPIFRNEKRKCIEATERITMYNDLIMKGEWIHLFQTGGES